jgi:hypothetical protein
MQNWLFGPAWSVFYTSMGVASWFVARSDKKGRAAALALYGAQLAVNLAWTPLFFKAHALDVALVDITSGWRVAGAGVGGGTLLSMLSMQWTYHEQQRQQRGLLWGRREEQLCSLAGLAARRGDTPVLLWVVLVPAWP